MRFTLKRLNFTNRYRGNRVLGKFYIPYSLYLNTLFDFKNNRMILFNEIIFGPVKSRRLGISLGVNLLPVASKYCNFNCIYCECGLSENNLVADKTLPSREVVKKMLNERLAEMKNKNEKLDAITFAGNGEPTIHPAFEGIINDTIETQNIFYPEAVISVLTNATMLHKDSVFNALKKIEKKYLKIDSAIEETLIKINRPPPNFNLRNTIENIKKFNGDFILQTMFIRGKILGEIIDNTTEKEVSAWVQIIEELRPKLVSIYAIQRVPPYASLEIISQEVLENIAYKVKKTGIHVEVAK